MASSEARVAANRRNAQRSTGPRTDAGKGRSRANALKHGLSGDGVVLSIGDGPAVDAAEARLAAEFNPDGEVATALVRRAAVLLVRLGRCADHDHAATAHRVRHAAADFDDQQADEVAALAARIEADPADAVRRLRRTPGGVDWLLGRWRAIHREVAGTRQGDEDAASLADRVGTLLGLKPDDGREPFEADLDRWCRDLDAEAGTRDRVGARVDGEIAALRRLRAEVAEVAEADRAEAPARALFDDGPAGQRARKYEAAVERGLFRVLRELREARAQAATATAPPPVPASPPAPVAVAAVPPAEPTPPPVRVAPPVAWPARSHRDEVDVPLSIGLAAGPAKTNPSPGAQTNPSRRR